MMGPTCLSLKGAYSLPPCIDWPNRRSAKVPTQVTFAAAPRKTEMVEGVREKAMEAISSFHVLPRLVVFDLDYTLWPFYCEFSSGHDKPHLFREAEGILYALKDKVIDLGIASRTPTPEIAKSLLGKLGFQSMFVTQEIFPSWTDKTEHFKRIHTATGVPFNSMLFFDDENRNIRAVSKMGVTSILVDNGINIDALKEGLRKFANNNSGSSSRDKQTHV